MNMENVMQSLEMLAQGMIGIFVVLGIIALLLPDIRSAAGPGLQSTEHTTH